jgi:radical SAM protein with 4Fe4S-binding SPASM domain
MITILNKLSDAEVFNISITGGEPLLNCSATLVGIKLARSKGMGVGLNSNLVLLTKEKAKDLKQAGIEHVLTSILGSTAEIHDSITQRKGSFSRLIEGVRVAHEAGIRVSANMVVSQLNYDDVIRTAQVVAKLGIKDFMATKAGCPGNCSDFSHLQLSQMQLTKFLNDLCWVHEKLGLHVDSLEPIPFCGLYGVNRPELFTSRRCNAGIMTATISYDGSVRPCPHFDISYGNLLTEDLSTIWARMDSWSQGAQVPYECLKCELRNICGSGCRMEAKTSTGVINGLDSFTDLSHVVEMTKVIMKPSERVLVKRFKTPKFKLRKEDFGGVFVSGKRNVFLDVRGFAVLSQLKPEITYDLATLAIDWNGLDPEKFVSGLAYRYVVSSI